MILADYIFIGAAIVFGIAGLMIGFGKSLNFMTKGIKGILISIVICYLIFGFVLNLGFVQTLLAKFVRSLSASKNGFVKFLLTIRIDVIALAVVLFGIVQIARKIIVSVIENIMEANNKVMRAINKTLGMILAFAIFLGLMLIVGQIIYAGNGAKGVCYEHLKGSFFHLDELYLKNPMTSIIKL